MNEFEYFRVGDEARGWSGGFLTRRNFLNPDWKIGFDFLSLAPSEKENNGWTKFWFLTLGIFEIKQIEHKVWHLKIYKIGVPP